MPEIPDTATNRIGKSEPGRHILVEPAVGQHGGLKGCSGSQDLPWGVFTGSQSKVWASGYGIKKLRLSLQLKHSVLCLRCLWASTTLGVYCLGLPQPWAQVLGFRFRFQGSLGLEAKCKGFRFQSLGLQRTIATSAYM